MPPSKVPKVEAKSEVKAKVEVKTKSEVKAKVEVKQEKATPASNGSTTQMVIVINHHYCALVCLLGCRRTSDVLFHYSIKFREDTQSIYVIFCFIRARAIAQRHL